MITPDTTQTAIAIACVMDATLSALDPGGVSLRRACRHLNDGLRLAEEMGVQSEASDIVRKVVANLTEMETSH